MSDRMCPTCGSPARAGARFCAACGTEIPVARVGATGTVIAAMPEVDTALVSKPAEASPARPSVVSDSASTGEPSAPSAPPVRASFPNAVLGWFVVGSLVLPLVSGTELNPTPSVAALVLGIGLVVSRLRKKRFGKHWLLATVIVGVLGVFGGAASAASQNGVDANSGSLFIPGVLALIARIRFGREAAKL